MQIRPLPLTYHGDEGRGGNDSLLKVLPRNSPGSNIVCSRDKGSYRENYAEVRGSPCDFPVRVHTKRGNATEGWVLMAGDDRSSSIGIGYTDN